MQETAVTVRFTLTDHAGDDPLKLRRVALPLRRCVAVRITAAYRERLYHAKGCSGSTSVAGTARGLSAMDWRNLEERPRHGLPLDHGPC